MTLAASQSRQVAYHRPAGWGIGVVDPLGRGFSILTTPTSSISTRRAGLHLESFGARQAERDLMRLVQKWRALGSPDHRDLIMEVHFGRRAPRAWRRQRRDGQVLTFDWKTARA